MDIINRLDDALLALVVSLVIQALLIVAMILLKRPVGIAPLIEIVHRSVLRLLIDRLNRSDRGQFALMIRGSIVFFLVLVSVFILFIGLEFVLKAFALAQYHHLAVLLLCFSPYTVMVTVLQVSANQKTEKGFYHALALSVYRNMVRADQYAQRRAGGQALVIALTEWMMAPLVIYVVFGVPVLALYVTLSLFIRGVSDDRNAFVMPFYWLYALLKLFPSSLLSLLLCVASIFASGGNPTRALKGLRSWKKMPLATLAYAQNVILGGATQNLNGQKIKCDWYGPEGATAKLDHNDVIRLCVHCGVTVFLTVVTLYIFFVFSGDYI